MLALLVDSKVTVGKDTFDGFTLSIGKKTIGEIADMAGQFAIIKNGNVDSLYKKLEKAVEILIENYNQNIHNWIKRIYFWLYRLCHFNSFRRIILY